jgi:hypothetical protein
MERREAAIPASKKRLKVPEVPQGVGRSNEIPEIALPYVMAKIRKCEEPDIGYFLPQLMQVYATSSQNNNAKPTLWLTAHLWYYQQQPVGRWRAYHQTPLSLGFSGKWPFPTLQRLCARRAMQSLCVTHGWNWSYPYHTRPRSTWTITSSLSRRLCVDGSATTFVPSSQ